jgi:hypothetical protein
MTSYTLPALTGSPQLSPCPRQGSLPRLPHFQNPNMQYHDSFIPPRKFPHLFD